MGVQQRVMLCRLLEKLEENPEYGKRLGVTDTSRYEADYKSKTESAIMKV